MIAQDWLVAQVALQIIAEQGPGLAVMEAENAEMAALSRLRKMVH